MSTTPNTNLTPQQVGRKMQEETVNAVQSKVIALQQSGDLQLPADYSLGNALKAAWLFLLSAKDRSNRPYLDFCTTESIVNALFEMTIDGLNIAKGQGYFIPYGNTLTWSKSYLGNIAIAKRTADVKEVTTICIYEGDLFEYKIDVVTGKQEVTKHEQSIDNIDNDKLKGVYAIVEYNDGTRKTEIMTMKKVRVCWAMGPTKGQSPAHQNFPDEMAKKTIINRILKVDIGSSDDSDLLPNRELHVIEAEVDANANKTSIGFPPVDPQQTKINADINPSGEDDDVPSFAN